MERSISFDIKRAVVIEVDEKIDEWWTESLPFSILLYDNLLSSAF